MAKTKLFDKVEDAITLDVTTLTGQIDISISQPPEDPKAAFKDIASKIEEAVAKGAMSGELEVVGWTKVEIDKDVKQFFRSGLTPETKTYLEAHNKAVETSLNQRSKFVETIIGLI